MKGVLESYCPGGSSQSQCDVALTAQQAGLDIWLWASNQIVSWQRIYLMKCSTNLGAHPVCAFAVYCGGGIQSSIMLLVFLELWWRFGLSLLRGAKNTKLRKNKSILFVLPDLLSFCLHKTSEAPSRCSNYRQQW